jgi:hypothetical protein
MQSILTTLLEDLLRNPSHPIYRRISGIECHILKSPRIAKPLSELPQEVALDCSSLARKMLWSAPRPQAVRTSCTLRTGAQDNTRGEQDAVHVPTCSAPPSRLKVSPVELLMCGPNY